jgi:hypothetical protein
VVARERRRTPERGHEARRVLVRLLRACQRVPGRVVIALVALLLVAAALGVVLLVRVLHNGKDGGERRSEPRNVSVQELRAVADSLPHPLYWAGTMPGFKLELTKTRDGNLYVRYLPEDVPSGDKRGLFTTIGTYPMRDAFEMVKRAGRQKGAVESPAPGGGIAVTLKSRPSIYLAYPGTEVLVEVFARRPGSARELLRSGRVGQIR